MVLYPTDYAENLKYRADIHNKTFGNPLLQAQLWEMSSRDILFWVNTFCWTKDPRKKISDIPFVCYDTYQDDYILSLEAAIDNQHDTLLEKSRDMGASWMVLYVFQHKWLFHPGSDFRVGSRKQDFVDKTGDIDTLFEKLRYNLKRQPRYMKPKGFDWRNHSTYMSMINPANDNAIVGESANENFGTGGRRKAVLLDEFAKWDDNPARGAWTSLADVTKCRIPVATPFGVGTKYHELQEDESIEKITLHWTLHPEKSKGAYWIDRDGKKHGIASSKEAFRLWVKYRSLKPPTFLNLRGGVVRSEWYDYECLRRKDHEIAQELDIDSLHSGVPFFDSQGLRQQKENQAKPIAVGMLRETAVGLEWIDRENGDIIIYEWPDKVEDYLVTADASEAIGQDEASALVGNVRLNAVAAVVADQHPSYYLARVCVLLSRFYGNAKIIPETKSYGTALCKYIDDLNGNIHKDEQDRLGFITSSTSRPEMLAYLDDAVRISSILLLAEKVIDQCITFVKNPKKGMKPEASYGKEDGLVICTAIFQIMRRIYPWKNRETIEIKRNVARDRALENRKKRLAKYRIRRR